jgi:hypothetical protein
MPNSGSDNKIVSQITVDPRPAGTVAVYMVEVSDEQDAISLRSLFVELEPDLNVKQLSKGRLVTYAVQSFDSDVTILDELDTELKNTYPFVITQRSFDPMIYRIVKELCSDTGSKLMSVPRCNICGKLEPFPDTLVTLADETGKTVASRSYCGTCTAGLVVRTNKDFVRSLLSADRHDFSGIENSELVRSRGTASHLRFKVSSSI